MKASMINTQKTTGLRNHLATALTGDMASPWCRRLMALGERRKRRADQMTISGCGLVPVRGDRMKRAAKRCPDERLSHIDLESADKSDDCRSRSVTVIITS